MDGAHTQAAGIGKMLRMLHNTCGERPQVGKVFRVRGTNSNAVFFTVVNHPGGNKQLAGMVIAAQSGPQRVEAAVVLDDASRFDSTVNPMIQQLLSEWHPGESGLRLGRRRTLGRTRHAASGCSLRQHSQRWRPRRVAGERQGRNDDDVRPSWRGGRTRPGAQGRRLRRLWAAAIPGRRQYSLSLQRGPRQGLSEYFPSTGVSTALTLPAFRSTVRRRCRVPPVCAAFMRRDTSLWSRIFPRR